MIEVMKNVTFSQKWCEDNDMVLISHEEDCEGNMVSKVVDLDGK